MEVRRELGGCKRDNTFGDLMQDSLLTAWFKNETLEKFKLKEKS
jgi:hypothetical protein